MKTVLPWIVAVIGIAAAAYFFTAQKSTTTEVAKLQVEVQELQTLRTENADLKAKQVPADELSRLRKDSEDVLRLRNEVRQLRETKTQLTQQAQNAEAVALRAQDQAAQAKAEAVAIGQRATTAAQQQTAEQAAFAARYGTAPGANPQDMLNACINNLRQLDGAKQQWALENRKTAEAVPNRQEIVAYLKGNVLPQCPAGGRYTVGAVNVVPTCSITGHALPQ